MMTKSPSLRLSKKGEPHSSFLDLYEKYHRLVRAILYKLCPVNELDDLAQEAFLKIWKAHEDIREPQKQKTWICRIAYHVACDYLRSKRIHTQSFHDVLTVANPDHTPVAENLLQRCLSEISLEHRAVIVLHCLEENSLEEVADILEIPIGTVKSRLHTARKQLYDLIRKHGGEL